MPLGNLREGRGSCGGVIAARWFFFYWLTGNLLAMFLTNHFRSLASKPVKPVNICVAYA